jgi:hypothetical protein
MMALAFEVCPSRKVSCWSLLYLFRQSSISLLSSHASFIHYILVQVRVLEYSTTKAAEVQLISYSHNSHSNTPHLTGAFRGTCVTVKVSTVLLTYSTISGIHHGRNYINRLRHPRHWLLHHQVLQPH